MSGAYKAEVTVHPYSWTVTQGDAMPLAAGQPVVTLPLSITWAMPQDGRALAQPDATRAQVSVVALNARDLRNIDVGGRVWIQLSWPSTRTSPFPAGTKVPVVAFEGKIAEVSGRPRKIPTPLGEVTGYQVDVTAVDATADLAEYDVAGVIPFQGIGVQTTAEELFRLAGLEDRLSWWTGGWGAQQLVLNDGVVDSATLLAAVTKLLSSYADGGPISYPTGDVTHDPLDYVADEANPKNHAYYASQGWRYGVIRPNGSDWIVDWQSRRNVAGDGAGANTYPGTFQVVAGKWTMVINPVSSGTDWDLTQVVDADYVDFDAEFTRTKNTRPTQVLVTTNRPEDDLLTDMWRQVYADTGESRTRVVERVTDCNHVYSFNAQFAADLLLPEPAPYKDQVKGFRWHASEDPNWPFGSSWWWDSALWFGMAIPVVVDGIAPGASAADDRGRYVGTINGATFTLDPGGRFYADFTLSPGAPQPGAEGFLAPNQLPASAGGVALTPANVNPLVTVADLRLCRDYM